MPQADQCFSDFQVSAISCPILKSDPIPDNRHLTENPRLLLAMPDWTYDGLYRPRPHRNQSSD